MIYSLKEKLLLNYIENDYIEEEQRYTPLRRFVDSLGLDHTKLTRKQMRKWSSTKRYKNFLALRKIKRIADEANVKENVISTNQYHFISGFYSEDIYSDIISEEEVISFLAALDNLNEGRIKISRPRSLSLKPRRPRGKYKSLAQRKSAVQSAATQIINKGGTVSYGASGPLYAGKSKHTIHSTKALGANQLALRSKRPYSSKYGFKLHRNVIDLPR